MKQFTAGLVHSLANIVRLFLRVTGYHYVEKTIHGQKVQLPVSGYALSLLIFHREYLADYEDGYFDAVLKQIRPGDIVFDVGAFKGICTVFMSRAVGDSGKVVAFEPVPTSFRILVDTVMANGCYNVIPVQKAVGNEIGQARLWIKGEETSLQSFEDRLPKIEVELTTVDYYVESTGYIPQILKIDVEGFELHVLEGAKRTLAGSDAYAVRCILTK